MRILLIGETYTTVFGEVCYSVYYDKLTIDVFALEPAFIGKGFARELFYGFVNHIKTEGYEFETVELEACSSRVGSKGLTQNQLEMFYERLGFEFQRTIVLPTGFPAVLMSCTSSVFLAQGVNHETTTTQPD